MFSKLQQFTSEVAQYQKEYPWLLLLSIPKIILISNLLKICQTSTFNIACEMIYLAKESLKWEEMELQVEVGWRDRKDQVSIRTCLAPYTIGYLLSINVLYSN